jgi:hypothetical protein
MSDAGMHASALAIAIESVRLQHLPDCTDEASEASGTQAEPAAPPAAPAAKGTSLAMLQRSEPARSAVADAIQKLAELGEMLERISSSLGQAIQLSEEADALAHEPYDRARKVGLQAAELLDQADQQLSDIKDLLSGDAPAEVQLCPHCGKPRHRVRKVSDPAARCARADEPMQEVEQKLQRAQALAREMENLLGQARPRTDAPDENLRLALAIRQIRGERDRIESGVIDQLSLAQERTQEFRKQQFDFYPGDTYPTEIDPVELRAFPPMVASYAARETWHYPDYFQDLPLERYGHTFGCVQPIVSYGKFLADLALLPYKVWLDPPCEPQYTMGLYRPGDCVPHLIYLPRPDCHAALFELGIWTGLAFLP